MSASRPQKGMQLFDADGELVGMIAGARGNSITVDGRHIPKSAIARVKQNRVYLKGAATHSSAEACEPAPARRRPPASVPIVPLDPYAEERLLEEPRVREAVGAETLVVPLAEERLHVEKRPTELGEVQVRKMVVEERQTVPVELEYEDVQVEYRTITPRRARSRAGLFQEGVARVPIRGEEAIVYKDAVITGEATIARERVTERRQIADTVRAERVVVDEYEAGQEDVYPIEYEEECAPPRPEPRVRQIGRPAAPPARRPAVRPPAAPARRPRVRVGEAVVGSDAHSIGQVKEVRRDDFLVARRLRRDIYVPFAAVHSVTGVGVMLTIPTDRVDEMGWSHPPLGA